MNQEKTPGYPDCFAVVDPNKDKKAKSGRGRFSVAGDDGERKLVPANYIVDGELELGGNISVQTFSEAKANFSGLGREIWSCNDKQFVRCDLDICRKILTDPSSLYRHKRIHTAEKDHKCPFCNNAFIQR